MVNTNNLKYFYLIVFIIISNKLLFKQLPSIEKIMEPKNLSEFIVSFISKHKGDKNIIEQWNSEETQKLFLDNLSSKKKVKDANAPKRGKSSYLYFCSEMRTKVQEANPNMSAKDITSYLGTMWNELKERGPQAIQKYVDLAEQDRSRYNEEKSNYVPVPSSEKKSKKKVKDANAPKRGKSSYLYFCSEMRTKVQEANPDMSAKDVTSYLGVLWSELKEQDPEAVQRYVAMAEQDRSRYNEEKSLLSSSTRQEQHQDAPEPKHRKVPDICGSTGDFLRGDRSDRDRSDKGDRKKDRSTREDKSDKKKEKVDRKKRREPQTLEEFSIENREEVRRHNPEMSSKEITKELKKLWKAQNI
jgi:hypothetical protein